MKQRLTTAVYGLAAKRNILAVSMLAIGAVVASADPAAARIALNHNETLVRDAG